MANIPLADEEYTFIVNLEKDLLARAKAASPRAAAHMQTIAKQCSDFLAREEGKRAERTRRENAKAERDALKLQKQQERLQKLQQAAQSAAKPAAQPARNQARTSA
jgi:hypothetical protein